MHTQNDDTCARCGHPKSDHSGGHCKAMTGVIRINPGEKSGSGIFYCDCTGFVRQSGEQNEQ